MLTVLPIEHTDFQRQRTKDEAVLLHQRASRETTFFVRPHENELVRIVLDFQPAIHVPTVSFNPHGE